MHLTDDDGAVVLKTKELCETLVSQPEFQQILAHMAAFMQDEATQSQYAAVSEKGGQLNHKQRQGIELTDAEIADFERERDSLLENPVARQYLDAQQQMHQVKEMVTKYVTKTFELGRMPAPEDFQCGSCCSCGGH